MKQLINIAALLTIAAALATTIISCSSDNDLPEQVQQPIEPAAEPQTVSVTVGAGISNDQQTRSAVVTAGGTRTLTFTAGDRLYVLGRITGTDPQKIVAGYLDIVGTPAEGATTASFSGDLSVYVYNSSEGRYDASSHTFATDDPLGECADVYGTLLHKDAVGFTVDADKWGEYSSSLASTVNELMTTMLCVQGTYNSGTKSFPLSVYLWGNSSDTHCAPIFNCTISGLKPSTTYNVSHIHSASFENALDGHGSGLGTITSDAEGNASFACYNVCVKAEQYHILNFLSDDYTDDRNVYLGSKALAGKVYNITRPALKFQEAAFSVSSTKQVYFSKGNLYAYKGSSDWQWYFQSHQWEYVGNASGNTKITGPMTLSASYLRVDLFGWNGASSPNDCYGINNSTTDTDYGTGDGEALMHDWGHNVIGSYAADTWRTPTVSEWDYLIDDRTVTNSLSAGARYTMATLGGTYKGLILFPDTYTHPSGTGFTAGTFNAVSNYTATVSMEGWMLMENAGCVFLPAAGGREETNVNSVGVGGFYWSATAAPNGSLAQSFCFKYLDMENSGIDTYDNDYRRYGSSVRLVRDVE